MNRDIYIRTGKVLCPDCGEETVFECGSLLGTKISAPSIASIKVLIDSMIRENARLERRCTACRLAETRGYFWIESAEGAVQGPLCDHCFGLTLTLESDGPIQERRIYELRLTKTNIETVLSWVKDDHETSSPKPAIDLF